MGVLLVAGISYVESLFLTLHSAPNTLKLPTNSKLKTYNFIILIFCGNILIFKRHVAYTKYRLANYLKCHVYNFPIHKYRFYQTYTCFMI
jgi:hypothetical protein